jgi:hypothetical protein
VSVWDEFAYVYKFPTPDTTGFDDGMSGEVTTDPVLISQDEYDDVQSP